MTHSDEHADTAGEPSTGSLDLPDYDRSDVTAGIAHLGPGSFHRAHQAMYLDRLMSAGLAHDWGVLAVGVLPADRRLIDALTSQDGKYALVVKHADGRRESRVIGSVIEAVLLPDDPAAVVRRLSDPAIRIVSMTITEDGYPEDLSVLPDAEPGATPASAFGLMVEALRLRRDAGVPPFSVMSCDNLVGNGEITRGTALAFARIVDRDLADWIAEHVAFPSSMVDRITPATTPEDIARLEADTGRRDAWPVVCESFAQWVLEDTFSAGRPPLERVGVQVVPDVAPYELMKLRLLNAGHQAIAYLGLLAGYRFTHEVLGDPTFREFLRGYLEHEAVPTLPPVPGVDLPSYCRRLLERLANPEVHDTLARLAVDPSDRIPKFLLPVVEENLRSGGEIGRAALVVAGWARYLDGVDDSGEPIEVVDRNGVDDPLASLDPAVASDDRFRAAYDDALAGLRRDGARATVARLS